MSRKVIGGNRKIIGEVLTLERIDYRGNKFIQIGEIAIIYAEIQEWCHKHNTTQGYTRAFIEEWLKKNKMSTSLTVVPTFKEYIYE